MSKDLAAYTTMTASVNLASRQAGMDDDYRSMTDEAEAARYASYTVGKQGYGEPIYSDEPNPEAESLMEDLGLTSPVDFNAR
jgi:hypothetical protein